MPMPLFGGVGGPPPTLTGNREKPQPKGGPGPGNGGHRPTPAKPTQLLRRAAFQLQSAHSVFRLKVRQPSAMPPRKSPPRVNVVVTEEQLALLLEFARLDPDTRSASAFLRAMLDQATPLLRKTVPLMRAAAEELASNRAEVRTAITHFLSELHHADLLDEAPGAPRTERSEGGRAKRPASRG